VGSNVTKTDDEILNVKQALHRYHTVLLCIVLSVFRRRQ
jgi:hypothetical protein